MFFFLGGVLGKGAYLSVADEIEKSNDIRASSEVLQNLDLSLNLLLLNGLEHLDYAFLIVDNVDSLKDFRVLSAAWIPS